MRPSGRCLPVLFLVSRAWLASRWCLREFNLARRLNKRLFAAAIEAMPLGIVIKGESGDLGTSGVGARHNDGAKMVAET